MEVKQIIVVRNDLRSKLRHAKLAAMVSHASMAAFFKYGFVQPVDNSSSDLYSVKMSHEMEQWITGTFTKIVLKCDGEDELMDLVEKCSVIDELPYALIEDLGRTVFREPTKVCVGIGPHAPSIISDLTRHFSLY